MRVVRRVMHTKPPSGAVTSRTARRMAARRQTFEMTANLQMGANMSPRADLDFVIGARKERPLTHKVIHSVCASFGGTVKNEGLKRQCYGEALELRTLQVCDTASQASMANAISLTCRSRA